MSFNSEISKFISNKSNERILKKLAFFTCGVMPKYIETERNKAWIRGINKPGMNEEIIHDAIDEFASIAKEFKIYIPKFSTHKFDEQKIILATEHLHGTTADKVYSSKNWAKNNELIRMFAKATTLRNEKRTKDYPYEVLGNENCFNAIGVVNDYYKLSNYFVGVANKSRSAQEKVFFHDIGFISLYSAEKVRN